MTIVKDTPYIALTDKEAKELAQGIIEDKIFTSDHVHLKDHKNLSSIFVPLRAVGEEFWQWTEAKNIDMLYAEKKKRNTVMSYFNGYPVFFEMRCLDRADRIRVWDICSKLRKK